MQPLKFGNGYVISSHILSCMQFLIHGGVKVNHVSKGDPGDANEHGTLVLNMQRERVVVSNDKEFQLYAHAHIGVKKWYWMQIYNSLKSIQHDKFEIKMMLIICSTYDTYHHLRNPHF